MRRNHNSDNHNKAIPWIKRNVSFLSWAGGLLAASFSIGWYVGSNNSKMEMYEKIYTIKSEQDKELREIMNENIKLINELSIERSKKDESNK